MLSKMLSNVVKITIAASVGMAVLNRVAPAQYQRFIGR